MYSSIGSTYETGFGHDPGLLSFLAKTLPLLPAHSHILDLGSGTGRPVASTLAETGHQVFGLDFSETMIALAKTAVPNATFALGDMRSFEPLEYWHVEEGFDAVFSILSLFIFSREEIEGMVGKWARIRFTLFGREGWRWLLGRNGFEVLWEETDLFRPPVEAESNEEPHWFFVARRL
ncbi:hypothetical protein EYC84_008274 [Monilinia fructicola]|uniref:Methyltransferase domain-containing protein n=1 Tax=Monilinia fructicola TaxID=38448 RepID=A0A5M9JIL3_MONFR|nr:hypothetical protein EYC84_008274 [Monilinia fructicola]